jgi:precorrin-6B methylase 2
MRWSLQDDCVLDVGCGPVGILGLLAETVGAAGKVVGLEREQRFVEMANAEVAQLGLKNVTVVQGDALSSGLRAAR